MFQNLPFLVDLRGILWRLRRLRDISHFPAFRRLASKRRKVGSADEMLMFEPGVLSESLGLSKSKDAPMVRPCFLSKDCYFNKKTRIVTFRNAADFLLLLNSSKEVSFDEIHRAFQFQK